MLGLNGFSRAGLYDALGAHFDIAGENQESRSLAAQDVVLEADGAGFFVEVVLAQRWLHPKGAA